MRNEITPEYILNRHTETLPGVWKCMEARLQNAEATGRSWSNVCLLPGVDWEAITSQVTGNGIDYDLASVLAAVGAWRLYRGIYVFPSRLRSALLASKVKGKLPADTLLRLPEHCPYIDTRGHVFGELVNPSGFWVYVDHLPELGKFDLKFVLNVDSKHYFLVSIELGEHTIAEGLDKVIERSDETWAVSIRPDLATKCPAAIGYRSQLIEVVQSLVSLVLFICKEKPEIDCFQEPQSRPTIYTPKKTKRGRRWFPADRTRTWTVGVEANQVLLDHHRRNGFSKVDRRQKGRRRSPERHPRDAHWHSVRTGKGRKMLEPRWYSAIWVGGEGDASEGEV